MAKKFENGTAPVSKYAAKKAARVKANREIAVDETKLEEQENAPEVVTNDDNNIKFDKRLKGLPPFVRKMPKHVVEIALILMNNAEIRRFTGIGICNYLKQKSIITGDKNFTVFKWNKFAVISNGLSREFNYSEPFFIKCLVASFASFSASAQKTIEDFCNIEMNTQLTDTVSPEDVESIVTATKEYSDNK